MTNKATQTQSIIDALQELNTLLDEEAQPCFDPEDKELWARVGNRIDSIDYHDTDQSKIVPINPIPSGSSPLELVIPHAITEKISLKPLSLSAKISSLVNRQLHVFGIGPLNDKQQKELSNNLNSLLDKQ